jgi:hemerythrin-like domain-containing protein
MTDIVDVILEEHSRIGRLFSALDDASRYAGPGEAWIVLQAWERLAGLLEQHADAEVTSGRVVC